MADELIEVRDAVLSPAFVRLTLSQRTRAVAAGATSPAPVSTDGEPQPLEGVHKITLRPVSVKKQRLVQFTYFERDRVKHENCTAAVALKRVTDVFADQFQQLMVETRHKIIRGARSLNGPWRVKVESRAPARNAANDDNTADRGDEDGPIGSTVAERTEPPDRNGSRSDSVAESTEILCVTTAGAESLAEGLAHDRAKNRLLPEGVPVPFLVSLGVMTLEGRVRSAMQHKFRQINRFCELVADVIPDLPAEGTLRIVDFGCGKSYLTFAMHHLLTRVHRRDVRVLGLDRRVDVVATCNRLAREFGCDGLHFEAGDIQSCGRTEEVDLAVSLHACDTATDESIARAVEWNAQVILAVPCCHKELFRQIASPALAPLLRYGLCKERVAALGTDALRAALLEALGYSTQIVEFIELEHTPKNVLIRAVRMRVPAAQRRHRLQEFETLRDHLAASDLTLERLLGSRLGAAGS